MPVIAFTQEMGSLAKDVAIRVAEELKLDSLRHEVLEHVASRMHVPKSLVTRLREGKAGVIEAFRADRDSMAIFTNEELLEVAAKGNVVLRGWGASCLLRPVKHVLSVRITRPFDQRVKWLMDHLDTDDLDMATEEVRRSDHGHASRMHATFGVTWGDPLLYDLVLNTDRISIDGCVDVIRDLVARPEFAETPESQAHIRNMALEAHVRSALRANENTHDVRITIDCRDGQVTLSGIVLSETERALTRDVTAAVAGVTGVDDQLRVMKRSKLFTSS
ncbi:MAG: cytidylate kinase family protein [Rubrivivax sp.]|nr:cytidylate kinase family protein [Rubrivivax sp.]